MSTDFKIIDDFVRGNITISADTQINNLDADEVIVTEKVTVRMFGKIKNLLVVKQGSTVIFHGTINGEVKNEGGEFIHYEE